MRGPSANYHFFVGSLLLGDIATEQASQRTREYYTRGIAKQMSQTLSIIGTSNSIMNNGWADQAKKTQSEHNITVNNYSLGGCPSIYAAFALIYHPEIAKSDVIVFDFCINDLMAIDAGMISINHVIGYHSAAIKELSDRGLIYKSLFLLFPLRKHCGRDSQRALLDPIISLLERYGISYLDYDTEVGDWAQRTEKNRTDAFKDWAHFTPEFSKGITDRVISFVKEHPAQQDIAKIKCAPEIKITILSKPSPAEGSTIKGTSLREFPVSTFGAGEELPIAGDAYLIGILHWHHEQSLALSMYHRMGKSRTVIRRDWHNMFRCEPFSRAIPLDDQTKIIVENDHTIPADKHFGLTIPDFPGKIGTVDIVEMIGSNLDPERFGIEMLNSLTAAAPIRT